MNTLNAVTHIATSVSFTNLLLVAQGDKDVLVSQPRIRTGVRLYGEEEVVLAAKRLTNTLFEISTEIADTGAVFTMSEDDMGETMEKVNNKVIEFSLTMRTEEQKANKELYRLYRSVVSWSSIINVLVHAYDKGDTTVDMSVRAIRNKWNKVSREQLVAVWELLGAMNVEQHVLDLFSSSVNNLKRLVNVKGSSSAVDGAVFYASSAGIQVNINNVKYLVTTEWFTEARIATVRRVRITNWNLDSSYTRKCAELVKNNINLDGMDRDDIYLSLERNTENGSLFRVECPTLKMSPDVVAKTGFIEPGKFKDGMFTFYPKTPVQYPNIAEQSNGVFHSFVDGKKFAARQEKLNKDRTDALKVTIDNVVFLKDVPESMNSLFNTGCFYLSARNLIKYGVCRIVSNIQNGMLKGATNLATLVDSKMGVDHSFICASSFKGGLAGVMNVKGYSYDLKDSIEAPEGLWDKVVVNGVELDGVIASIEVMITNPYTLHSYTSKKSEVESDIDMDAVDLEIVEKLAEDYESESKDSDIAKEMLDMVISQNLTASKVIKEYTENYNLRLKKPFTTIVSSDFEAVRNTYGTEEAKKLIEALMSHPLNKATKKRKYAFDILSGEFNVIKEISIADVMVKFLDLMEEYSVLGNSFTSVNRNFLLLFVEALGANVTGKGWIKIVHLDGSSVHLPIGTSLYGDLLDTSNDLDKVVVTGMLPKVLESLYRCSKFKTMTDAVVSSLFKSLELEVQWTFINKELGRLKTPGKYFVALPGTWLEEKWDICLPGRDLYVPKQAKKTYILANMGKQPIIFHGSFSGCRVFKDIPMFDSMHPELREVLSCVVFVHPDYFLETQNDSDGDLLRVSFESHVLPFYDSGVLVQEGKNFFANYVESEKSFAVKDVQKIHTFTPSELQEAIAESVVAKMRVGAYTDRMHVISTHIDSLVAEGKINEGIRRMAVRFFGVLIQECAMNAIKHAGNGEGITVADSLNKHFMSQSDKNGKNIGIGRAKRMVLEFLNLENYDFSMFGMNNEQASQLLVAISHSINEVYAERLAETHRRLFKNRPLVSGEYLEFTGVNPAECEDSTFSILYSALKASV